MTRAFIELFAGCGGMSLGLQSQGFQLSLANELSPMAAETFAFNHFQVDLAAGTNLNDSRIKWISSAYPKSELRSRLRENPHEYPELHSATSFTDIPPEGITGNGELLVGSIVDLNRRLKEQVASEPNSAQGLRVDLVSGGPPCQSFSMAGLRQRDNQRNRLPWEFAKFVQMTRPRVALLENVSGILRAFTEENEKFHAWKEVAKAFVEVGYVPLCLHVNAKYVGVAQNRPRFLLFALDEEVAQALVDRPSNNAQEQAILTQGLGSLSRTYDWGEFRYWDIANPDDRLLFQGSIFRDLLVNKSSTDFSSVEDAIGDLSGEGDTFQPSRYAQNLAKLFGEPVNIKHVKNHEFRKHSLKIQQRFRLLQILDSIANKKLRKQITLRLKNSSYIIKESIGSLLDHRFLFDDGSLRTPIDEKEITDLIAKLSSRKHSQRALTATKPAPAALSIPDDCCHYATSELRTLTVREMARIQSFPDSFVFRSKVTTGGANRRFEVPQYTQVGNAVPPILARQAGSVVNTILKAFEESRAGSGESSRESSGQIQYS